jgi:hypothetical protein
MAIGRRNTPVGADGDAPIRPPMLQHAAAALLGGDRGGAALTGVGCLIPAGDLAVCARDEAVMAEGDSEAVWGPRPQGGRSAPARLTVNPPVAVPHLRIDQRTPLGLVSWRPERGPEEHGEGFDRHQDVFP